MDKERTFLIPANSKKSELHFGVFNNFDLILFCSGVGISLILMMALQSNELSIMMLILMPALIVSFLVFPVPYYHNVMQLIVNIYTYFFVRPTKYKWGGWNYRSYMKVSLPEKSNEIKKK